MPEEKKIFDSRQEAWNFVRECDKEGLKVGWPWAISADPNEKRYVVRYVPKPEKTLKGVDVFEIPD